MTKELKDMICVEKEAFSFSTLSLETLFLENSHLKETPIFNEFFSSQEGPAKSAEKSR